MITIFEIWAFKLNNNQNITIVKIIRGIIKVISTGGVVLNQHLSRLNIKFSINISEKIVIKT